MSISWGKRQRFKFNPGGTLNEWAPPMLPAVYAITYKQDPTNKPKAHTVLFFGQADDLSQQAARSHNHVLDFWANNGGNDSELFVFVLAMPDSTRWERSSVQEQLVSEYNPDCNRY